MANKRYFTDESLETFVDEIKSYTDSAVSAKADISHNHDDTYETKEDAQAKLNTAKSYTDEAVSQKSQVQIITWEGDD